jgi:hypothetical protein
LSAEPQAASGSDLTDAVGAATGERDLHDWGMLALFWLL